MRIIVFMEYTLLDSFECGMSVDKHSVSVKIFLSMGSIGVGYKRVEGCQVFGMRWEEKMWGVVNEEERFLRIKDHKMA